MNENSHKPAFSRPGYEHSNLADHDRYHYEDGLTKRELIAMVAMQGIISGVDRRSIFDYPFVNRTADLAIEYADALLKQLDK